MNCEEVEQSLYPYWDGERSGPLVKRMKNHISNCSRCRRKVDSLRELDRVLYASDFSEVPSDFTRDVIKQAREHRSCSAPSGETNPSPTPPTPERKAVIMTVMLLGMALGTVLGVDMIGSARATSAAPLAMNQSYVDPEPDLGDASLADIYFTVELHSDQQNTS